jgi:salicylate hydroxylase
LAAELERIANRTSSIILREIETGDILTEIASSDDSDYPHWGTTREELIKLFYSKAIEAGASVHFECTVLDVRDDIHQAYMVLKNGTTTSGDMILAADGIHSRTRYRILSDLNCPLEPVVSSITAYGFKLDALQVMKHLETSNLTENLCSNVWMGKDLFAVSRYSVKGQHLTILCHCTHAATDQKALWDRDGDISHVREDFGGACASIRRVLQIAKSCDRWRLAELPPLARWTSEKGRIALLGDSAHAMHPSAGQGFSQIVEDIEVLAQLVSRDASPASNTARLTRMWQDIRKSRVERIQQYSKWNTYRLSNGTSLLYGSQPLAWTPSQQHSINYEDFKTPEFVKWTLEYDAEKEASVSLSRS